ncbi:Clavaminate synthase-like protein [Leucogyrophana mollusca]|uniref:Clavaminate synthase-like protein n=1 Tax=Leucogyrophana mollusca TaxID=85980 RepID=A0ACB8BQN5_9AGAM|nr:Clavaminate synthase-like protein [Leucogyrophana mollusca]
MARSRRRTTRSAAQKTPEKTPEPSPASTRSSLTPVEDDQPMLEAAPLLTEEDTCPACKDGRHTVLNASEKESWIRCDACKTWYHWLCAGNGTDVETIDKWFCKSCVQENPSRTITLKPPARKSSRKRTQLDYANLHSGVESDASRWLRVIQAKPIQHDQFKRMLGSDVGVEWLETDETAMREPIVIESPKGLGMKMPDPDFTVSDVADTVGHDTPVEVIDVASQSNSPGWTLGKWAEYYNLEPPARDKIRNVISLEISGTKLADQVLPPRLVRELDWVEKFWPNTRRGKGHAYPKVQLYCLMGVASAWTDWHVDFAGSSVYYHILRGSKVFYFIRPTSANLAAYEKWSGTELQNNVWLGDMVDEVIKVTLEAGNTMIIPTGWIHAVHTPIDSLVFGGNFLHSYNVATQLKVLEIEKATHVPKKFRFPLFSRLCWYVGDKYLRDLKAKEEFSPRVLESLEALAGFLVSEVRTMERGSDHAKREAKEQVPNDRVKDAAAVARELRWRVRISAGTSSDDEDFGRPAKKNGVNGHVPNGQGTKRKRTLQESADEQLVQFKNFQPKAWDEADELLRESEQRVVKARHPETGDSWHRRWMEWDGKWVDGGEDEPQASVESKREVIVKVRRADGGLERQRIDRVIEKWVWDDMPEELGSSRPDIEMKSDEPGPAGAPALAGGKGELQSEEGEEAAEVGPPNHSGGEMVIEN